MCEEREDYLFDPILKFDTRKRYFTHVVYTLNTLYIIKPLAFAYQQPQNIHSH